MFTQVRIYSSKVEYRRYRQTDRLADFSIKENADSTAGVSQKTWGIWSPLIHALQKKSQRTKRKDRTHRKATQRDLMRQAGK